MIRAGDRWAVAVRRPDGAVVAEGAAVPPWAGLGRRLPLVRGAVALVVTVALGLRALGWSRRMTGERPETAGTRAAVAGATALSLTVFVTLFALLPAAAARLLGADGVAFALLEALVRVGLLVGYVAAIGRLPGIARTYAYHGAEHAAVSAFEAGAPLTVAGVGAFGPRHARCGTDFLVLSAVVAVAVFALATPPGWAGLLASRVLLLPAVAGVAYELLRLAARPTPGRILAPLLAPGMAVQRLTTRPFGEAEAEVALAALTTALGSTAPATGAAGG